MCLCKIPNAHLQKCQFLSNYCYPYPALSVILNIFANSRLKIYPQCFDSLNANMRTVSLVNRLRWSFGGNMNPHALVVGDVDNDGV